MNKQELIEQREHLLEAIEKLRPPTLSTRILRHELIDELGEVDAKLLQHGVNNF